MKKILFLLPLLILWIFLFPIYKDRAPAFGCFDDCFNYMGGYFLNSGKRLYSEIFYNHQPILAYISAAVQKNGNPDNMYALVLQHRLFVIAWSIIWNVILTFRFGWMGVGFSVLYETTKGYVFGDRFLAEAIIVYPIVYLIGLIGKKITRFENSFISILIWFIIFSREPYIPLALLLFYLLKPNIRIFLGLSLGIILLHPLKDYFFQVFTVNTVVTSEFNILQSLFYPVLVFFNGQWNIFRSIEIGLVILLFLSIRKKLFLTFLLLALSNIRPVPPGTIYYEAFHHLVGYAVLLYMTIVNLKKFLWIGFVGLTSFAILTPKSYLYDRVDRNAEFTQNYGQYYVAGEVVRLLSDPNDTLFLDGYDDLIYWQAKRFSPYPYSWYTSFMHEFSLYTDARAKMFAENPPDFLYANCSDPQRPDYLRFYWQERPSCLFVHKEMYERISRHKVETVTSQFDYEVLLDK